MVWGSSSLRSRLHQSNIRPRQADMASKRKRAYWKYLESPHWKALRQEAFKRDGYKCRHCGKSSQLRGHHKRYRKNLFLCTVKDIETLCEPCHDLFHRTKARLRKERRKRRSQISHVAILLGVFTADIPATTLRHFEQQFIED